MECKVIHQIIRNIMQEKRAGTRVSKCGTIKANLIVLCESGEEDRKQRKKRILEHFLLSASRIMELRAIRN